MTKDKKRNLNEDQLYSLLESAKLINSTLDLEDLLTIIMQEITTNLAADRSTLYIVDRGKGEIWSKIAQGSQRLEIRQTIGKGISGWVAKTGKTLNIPDAYQDARFNPEVDRRSGYRTRSVLCMPVRDKQGETIGVVQVLNKKNGVFTREDEAFLEAFSDYIAVAIQNAQLYQEALERKKLESEMAVAAEIQRMLLPEKPTELDGYQIYAYQQPSRHIGGDYYDFFLQGDKLLILVADISGKGIPAALLMANLQATTRNLIETDKSNTEIVQCINRRLYSVTSSDKYATLFWASLDLKTHHLRYICAGHVPPILFSDRNGSITKRELGRGGIPVGMLPEFQYEEGTARLKPEDLVIICTDGITETQDRQGEMFETERVESIVEKHYHANASDIGQEIIRRVKEFSDDGVYEDDMTLVVLKMTGENGT